MKINKVKDLKVLYWFLIFCLLLVPLTHSFFLNINKLIKSFITYNDYKKLIGDLCIDNRKLVSKVKFYNSSQGIKTLIKDRLNKVEEGELLIKFNGEEKKYE